MYNLFGIHLYWILSILAVLYLFWGQKITHQILHSKSDIQRFIDSDPQLKNILNDLRILEKQDHFVYQSIYNNIMNFLIEYLILFKRNNIDNLDFQNFNDKRRTILNDLSTLIISDVQISENIINNIADCLWKYVYVIGTKFDLRFDEPLAQNSFIAQDMY